MTVMVALLRGVNVGGRASLAMADLRRISTDLGYDDVATYIQSGNLILSTTGSPSAVAKDLAAAIAEAGQVQPAVMVRTRAQLATVVDANPFVARGEDPKQCHVMFAEKATKASLARLDLDAYAPEEAQSLGKELYLFLPNGVGRSKLAADVAKQKDAVGTVRNWRTVTTLLEMADAAAR